MASPERPAATPAERELLRLGIDGPALAWASKEPRSLAVAWATCPNAGWLVDVLARLPLDRREVVRAASQVVSYALPFAATLPEARRAFDAAHGWLELSETDAVCWVAGATARDAAGTAQASLHARAALSAAARLALACDSRADPQAWADAGHAAAAVKDAVRAMTGHPGGARLAADAVRGHFPFERVAALVDPASRAPRHSGVVAREIAAERPDGRATGPFDRSGTERS